VISNLIKSIFGVALICLVVAFGYHATNLVAGPGIPLKHAPTDLDWLDFRIAQFVLCVFIAIMSGIYFMRFLEERRERPRVHKKPSTGSE